MQVMGFLASIILPTSARINQPKKKDAFFFGARNQSAAAGQPVIRRDSRSHRADDDDLKDSKIVDRNCQKRTSIQMSKSKKRVGRSGRNRPNRQGEEETEKGLTRDNGTEYNPTNRRWRFRRRTKCRRASVWNRPRSSRTKQQRGGKQGEGNPRES